MSGRLGRNALFSQWLAGALVIMDMAQSTGRRIFLDSTTGTDAGGNGVSPDAPVATLDYAVGLCTADQGDIIIAMPGHAEDVIAAAGIALDVEGITIIGLGVGDNRPTITFTTADTADIDFDADNVAIKNFRFICDIDALAAALDVNNPYCSVEDCEFIDLGTDNTLEWINVAATGDYFECINCTNRGTATAGNNAFISMAAATGVKVIGLVSNGDFAAANIDMSAAALDVVIEDCRLQNSNTVDVCIEGFAAATGWVSHNLIFIATDTILTGINTVGTLALFENYQINVGGETGILIGTPSA